MGYTVDYQKLSGQHYLVKIEPEIVIIPITSEVVDKLKEFGTMIVSSPISSQ